MQNVTDNLKRKIFVTFILLCGILPSAIAETGADPLAGEAGTLSRNSSRSIPLLIPVRKVRTCLNTCKYEAERGSSFRVGDEALSSFRKKQVSGRIGKLVTTDPSLSEELEPSIDLGLSNNSEPLRSSLQKNENKIDVPDGKEKSRFLSPTFSFDGLFDNSLSVTHIQAKRLENVPHYVLNKYPVGIFQKTKFAVQSKGGLADRFFLDVDYQRYPENAQAEEDSGITLTYFGKKGELLKSLYLGDTELKLPGAQWLSLKGKTGKVSRQSFAVQSTLSYKRLDFTLIGAHQKGKPETEYFEIGTNVQRFEIRDVDYVQRTFYQIVSVTDLPIDLQSVRVYYDDGNGFNNMDTTERFTPPGATHEGFYDLLILHDLKRGYELNPNSGVLKILFDLPFNASLAVSYRTRSGKLVEKQLIKSDDDSLTTELRNRYSLPEDLVDIREIVMEDKSGNQRSISPFSLDTIERYIIFESTMPFPTEVYQFPPSHLFIISLSYQSTGKQSMVRLSKEPILETLKIELNGKKLVEGTDYSLTSGNGQAWIYLYGAIAGDRVSVSYNSKDVPQVRQTVGAALTYGAENSSYTVSLSGLTDFSPRSVRAPSLGSDTAQVQMFGISIHGREQLGKMNMNFQVETAGSQFNPNPFGASIMDNFDSVRRSLKLEISEEFWRPSARPPSSTGQRTKSNIQFESVFVRDLVPQNPSERREQIMSFHSNAGEWFGVHRSLAPQKGFVDLRLYRYLEIFIFVENSLNSKLNIEVGEVSEDANGNGRLETEDANRDNWLDGSEDDGIPLEDSTIYGRGNNLLDTEDVSLDGRLDFTESFLSMNVDLNWSGWKKVQVPLQNIKTARYLRIWVTGSAKIKISKIEFTGLNYAEEVTSGSTLIASVVSNFSDPDAPSLINHPTFSSLYPDRTLERTDKSEFEKERLEDFSLALDYRVLSQGRVAMKKDAEMDLTNQKRIHFFIASVQPNPAIFFLRLGDSSNYFEYTVTINRLSAQYQEFSIDRDRFKIVGQPAWQDIREVRVGIFNFTSQTVSGKIFFNELFVSDPIVKKAMAFASESEVSYPFSFLGLDVTALTKINYLKVPDNFRTANEFLRGAEKYQWRTDLESKSGKLCYIMGRDILAQIFSKDGMLAHRISKSDYLSDKVEWNLAPKLGAWNSYWLGSFEKRDRSETNLTERLESSFNRLEISNDDLLGWIPKRTILESSFKKDLVYAKDTVGCSLQPQWRIFNGVLIFSPKAGFEDMIRSTSGFIVARKSLLAFENENRIPIFPEKEKSIFVQASGTSENWIQRSDYPFLSTSQFLKGNVSYNWDKYGNSIISTSNSENRKYVSDQSLRDASAVWKYQLKKMPFEVQSYQQTVEIYFSQENVRVLPIFSLPDYDWLGLNVRASLSSERKRYLEGSSVKETVQLPDITLIVSSAPWECSIGWTAKRTYGTGEQGINHSLPLQLIYKKESYELRNNFNFRKERQMINGSVTTDFNVSNLKTSVKLVLKNPFYQSLNLIRRNILLENRMDFDLGTDLEYQKGHQYHNAIEQLTSKIFVRAEYFFKDYLNIYLTWDGCIFDNRRASAMDYFVYATSTGMHLTF